jgi:hypothetical protein
LALSCRASTNSEFACDVSSYSSLRMNPAHIQCYTLKSELSSTSTSIRVKTRG